jgi:hypothetical protein
MELYNLPFRALRQYAFLDRHETTEPSPPHPSHTFGANPRCIPFASFLSMTYTSTGRARRLHEPWVRQWRSVNRRSSQPARTGPESEASYAAGCTVALNIAGALLHEARAVAIQPTDGSSSPVTRTSVAPPAVISSRACIRT